MKNPFFVAHEFINVPTYFYDYFFVYDTCVLIMSYSFIRYDKKKVHNLTSL